MFCESNGFMRKYFFASTVILGLICNVAANGFVSVNVPLDHWSYNDIDKLIGLGLIDSSMMNTKPVSRLEMARHIVEADEKFQRLNSQNEIISGILDRLKKEFEPELSTIGAADGKPILDFAKPFEDPYLKYVYAREKTTIENTRGDRLDENSNLRAGFAARAQLFDITAFYAHPEYIWSSEEGNQDVKLIEGYGKLGLGSFEIEAGKDSMFWGPGQHGALIMSNNADPFKMVKISNPSPISLPWIFRALGPVKIVWFLTQLEEDRPIPKPNLMGFRIEFKPHPAVEIGVSRTMIFGGQGRSAYSFVDYLKAFTGSNEALAGNLDNDQLGGFDASVLLPVDSFLPARNVKLYTEWIGEDEAGGLPMDFGITYGAKFYDIFKTGKTDLTIEYANDHDPSKPNVFYNHSIYQAGYTYDGRIIGHYMGTDSKDLFIRLTHYLSSDIILGLQCDKQTSDLSSPPPHPTLDRYQADVTFFTRGNWEIQAGYRHENASGTPQDNPVPIRFVDSDIVFVQITYDF
jgi:hypothetical protein